MPCAWESVVLSPVRVGPAFWNMPIIAERPAVDTGSSFSSAVRVGFPGLTLGATPWVAWIFLAGTPRLEVVPRLGALALDLARDARDVARDTLPLRDELPELRDALAERGLGATGATLLSPKNLVRLITCS